MAGLNPDPPIVRVDWEDITNIATWSSPAEVAEFAADGGWKCTNIGWLVYEDDDCYVVAARRAFKAKQLGLYERIPKRAVLCFRVLEGGQPDGTG